MPTPIAEIIRRPDPDEQAALAAVAGFLAGYCDPTRRSYATDLRLFAAWCSEAGLGLFAVRRAHIELFGRWMEECGRMRSTVARRLSTLASFYRYCHQEGLIDANPALNVRRPKLDCESRTLGLDRNELGAFLVQAGLGTPRDHALASLLALNGLRISEALGTDIEDLDFERGHRTPVMQRRFKVHRLHQHFVITVGEEASGCGIGMCGAGRSPVALCVPLRLSALPHTTGHH